MGFASFPLTWPDGYLLPFNVYQDAVCASSRADRHEKAKAQSKTPASLAGSTLKDLSGFPHGCSFHHPRVFVWTKSRLPNSLQVFPLLLKKDSLLSLPS